MKILTAGWCVFVLMAGGLRAAGPETAKSPEAVAAAPEAVRLLVPLAGQPGDVEVQFPSAMVESAAVGREAEAGTILAVTPPVTVPLRWRSTRSAVLPVGQLPIGASLTVALKSGLRDLTGKEVAVPAPVVMQGPAFQVTHATPRWFPQGGAGARLPRIMLFFNDEADAALMGMHAEFADGIGRKVPVKVSVPKRSALRRLPVPVGTWAAQQESGDGPVGDDPLTSVVALEPGEALPVGEKWTLVIRAGLANRSRTALLPQEYRLLIGDIPPFLIMGAEGQPKLDGPRSLVIHANKVMATEASPVNWAEWVEINPAPGELKWQSSGSTATATGSFALGIEYNVRVKDGLTAADGTVLAAPAAYRVTFAPHAPHLSLPAFDAPQWLHGQAEFVMSAANLQSVDLTVKRVPPELAPLALRGYGAYEHQKQDGSLTAIPLPAVPGRTVLRKSLPSGVLIDQSERFGFSWAEAGGGQRRPGLYFVNAEGYPKDAASDGADGGSSYRSQRRGGQAVIMLTDLGIAWKHAAAQTSVLVFSHSTGAPVGGARVALFNADAEPVREVVADADGLAEFPHEGLAWMVVSHGEDYHCAHIGGSRHALSMWSFGVRYGSRNDPREVLLFSERPVHQPGETVYLKAISRMVRNEVLALPPAGEKARLALHDPQGRLLHESEIGFSETGSFDGTLTLPSGVVGWFRAEISFPEPPGPDGRERRRREFSTFLLVQEYQPNAFRIAFGEDTVRREGEVLHLPVQAAYLMGKALSKATLRWTARLSPEGFSHEKWPDYQFGLADTSYVWDGSRYHEMEAAELSVPVLTGQGSLTLSESGTAEIAAPVPAGFGPPGPKRISIGAEITDINQQTIAAQWNRLEHSSAFYLGAKRSGNAVAVGEEVTLQLAAVSPDGTRHAEPLTIEAEIQHLGWNAVRVETAGGGTAVRSDPVFATVTKQSLEMVPGNDAGLSFRPAVPGTHLIILTAQDAAGRAVRTVARVDVYRADALVWRGSDGIRIELTPDRDRYAPGDTARILVKSPLTGNALVSVERGSVLWRKVVPLAAGGVVEIPVQDGWDPNVFVSVMHLRGGNDDSRAVKSPDYRFGFCELPVKSERHALKVSVLPSLAEFRPRSEGKVDAVVTTASGEPVAGAEVTLWAVDEGILSLREGWRAPDVRAIFHPAAELGVTTGTTLAGLFKEDPAERDFANKGYVVGGGGDGDGASPLLLRRDFRAVAFWAGALRSDAAGRVSVSFTAPDTLSEFRIMAVAAEGAARFGNGEGKFRINQPLMLEAALPRFVNAGDTVVLRGILHNNSPQAVALKVSLEAGEGVQFLESIGGAETAAAPRAIEVPAGATRSVEFPVVFRRTGTAPLHWKAEGPSAELSDAVAQTLMVGRTEPVLREVKFFTLSEASAGRNLLDGVRAEVLEGDGEVTVTLSNSRLLEGSEAIDQLLRYPYGCAEQTVSALLPWLALRDLRPALPSLQRSDEEIAATIQAGVARLLRLQTRSGGFGYWPDADAEDHWASSHAALGLVLARRAGAAVPDSRMESLVKWLSSRLRVPAEAVENSGQSLEACRGLWALALAGHPEASYHETYFSRREKLLPSARAFLALAIAESAGPEGMVRTLLTMPSTAAEDMGWLGEESVRAVRAMAWLRIKAPEADAELGRLLAERSPRGDWRNTYNNGWALLALSLDAARWKPWDQAQSCVVALGEEKREVVLAAGVSSQTVRLPRPAGRELPQLTVTTPAGYPVFASIEVSGRGAVGPQPERRASLGISRTYQKLSGDGSLEPAESLRTGDLVLVSLDIEVPESTHYLVIDDPLPATMEGVNPAFTSMAASDLPVEEWSVDYREMRRDRVLFFRNHFAGQGRFRCQYLARVTAAGRVMAPAARLEAMYDPEKFGLSSSAWLTTAAAN